MKIIIRSLLIALLPLTLLAQKDCPQQAYQQQLLSANPQLHVQYDKIETFTRHQMLAAQQKVGADSNNIESPAKPLPESIIIPVVVHVLWNSSAQNISDAQIRSQIDVLNKDFSGQNTDHNKIPAYFNVLSADCGITFALATTDAQGHATTGIVRKQTGVGVFGYDDKMKASATGGDDAWDAGSYLNIWVCNLVNGIAGYASIPGSDAAKDGVVISTAAFGITNIGGPFNKGRTAVHETGHWLNLRHTWGDASCGDDKVDDTPTQQGANRGCNSGEKFSCGNTAHGDMYMNFMDFSDDACMLMFTKGQRSRMRVLFEAGGPRSSLLASSGLNGESIPTQTPVAASLLPVGFTISLYPNPASTSIMLQVNDALNCSGNKIIVCNHLGQIVKIFVSTSKLQQLDISSLQAGLYFIKLEGAGVKKFVKQ